MKKHKLFYNRPTPMQKPISKPSKRLLGYSQIKRVNKPVALLTAAVVTVAGSVAIFTFAATTNATVQTTRNVVGTANFQVGFDHTQASHLAGGGNPAAVASAKSLLTNINSPQTVHLMGFGASNPEPAKGKYQWDPLDVRVAVMGDTVPESQRVITLYTAPGWMKGAGDWAMETPVQPAHFDDFAELAAQTALRYDGNHTDARGRKLPKVSYFNVWNEMKGFWNSKANRWDYEDYTAMYNKVYAAVKRVRPDAKIGGPYISIGANPKGQASNPSGIQGAYGVVDQRLLDVMTYWLKNKAGADYITIAGGPQNNTAGRLSTDGFTAGTFFRDIASWLRNLNSAQYPGAQNLPIYWTEYYPATGGARDQQAVAVDVDNAITAGLAGVNVMFMWEPEGANVTGTHQYTGYGLFTGLTSGGGKPTPLYNALKLLRDSFPPGTPIYGASVSGPVTALAGSSKVLLISKSSSKVNVNLNGSIVSLSPYEVKVAAITSGAADTTPPTLSIKSPTNGQTVSGNVNITVNATDNQGGSGVAKVEYRLDGNILSTVTAAPYSYTWNVGSTGAGNHTISAAAYDNAGNKSAAATATVKVVAGGSNGSSGTGGTSNGTNAAGSSDTTPPSTPTGLIATAVSATNIALSWTASADLGSGMSHYLVQRDGAVICQTPSTNHQDTTALPGSTYIYTVYAVDKAGNTSAVSNFQAVTTPGLADAQAPAAPSGLRAVSKTSSQVNLSWERAADNIGVKEYRVFRGSEEIGTTPYLSFGDATARPGTDYEYHVVAYDAAGNAGQASAVATIKTAGASSASVTLLPSDDTLISKSHPARNYGTKTTLATGNAPVENSVLKFTVSGTTGKTITRAKLWLYTRPQKAGAPGGNVYDINSNWSEKSLNWDNAPNTSGDKLTSLGSAGSGDWISADLSSLITGDGTYSVRIATDSGQGVVFNSKEAAINRPQLILYTQEGEIQP